MFKTLFLLIILLSSMQMGFCQNCDGDSCPKAEDPCGEQYLENFETGEIEFVWAYNCDPVMFGGECPSKECDDGNPYTEHDICIGEDNCQGTLKKGYCYSDEDCPECPNYSVDDESICDFSSWELRHEFNIGTCTTCKPKTCEDDMDCCDYDESGYYRPCTCFEGECLKSVLPPLHFEVKRSTKKSSSYYAIYEWDPNPANEDIVEYEMKSTCYRENYFCDAIIIPFNSSKKHYSILDNKHSWVLKKSYVFMISARTQEMKDKGYFGNYAYYVIEKEKTRKEKYIETGRGRL